MITEEVVSLDKRLAERPTLRCKNRECDMRKGFFVWKNQKEQYLKKKCILCQSDIVELNLVRQDE